MSLSSSKVSIRTEVCVPLRNSATTAQFVSFEGMSDGKEHIALIFKGVSDVKRNERPIVRIHSECLTGDVFSSQRCDCGQQLDEAISMMAKTGGILLYMRDEGRGIGLYNKLDAYVLQDDGVDTFEANRLLNLPEDMRNYTVCADILSALNVKKITLLSNNPDKVSQLRASGIDVEVIQTSVFQHQHNEKYLRAKIEKHGHKLQLRENIEAQFQGGIL